ncbi:histidinol-phosphate transaminase [Tautonia plasticadhaerens]|uniref:Histidinol-phosphate aminotransferase n=1 Tax=Tautonia plasticadhaerens TaxID=2527974 RepID=A0A518GWQ9_9BACT|nr:histidinol-phosphate transaminase [Tautonia plasticadhaerens]QDV33035.1 Histidinol-phosphate aminotransferase [Tautonia plasticadhaerens]
MSTPPLLPHVERMTGYVPGEQPRDPARIIKLNTNENPYPPSAKVAEAIGAALGDGRLRLYPDPTALRFREAVARRHGVSPEMVLAGNGSDDCLTILTRAFVGPGDVLAYPTPSYVLYRTLAEIQGARAVEVLFRPDWTIDPDDLAASGARLAFLANPNSPSGTAIPPGAVAELARRIDCPLVVDEAYGDFAGEDCIRLVSELENVVVTRTLSKGLSLAGLRIGYLIARPGLIDGLLKVKDSYNCDMLSLLGGSAALDDEDYTRSVRDRILATRARLAEAARSLGYTVPESHANFVWCEGGPPAEEIYESLKGRDILVRLMRYPGRPAGLRITVGTDEQIDRLLDAMREIVGGR